MKTLPRLLFLLILLTGFAAAPTVQAQGGDDLVCFNLPEDDCAILLAALESNATQFTSARAALDLTLELRGIAPLAATLGGSGEDVTLIINADGPIAIHNENAILPLHANLNGALTLTQGAQTQTADLKLIAVDDILYTRESTADGPGPWNTAPLQAVFDSLDPQSQLLLGGLLGAGGDPNALPETALSPDDLMPGTTDAMANAADLEAQLTGLLDTPGFIDHMREEDAALEDQAMAVFALTMDFDPLFGDPEFQQVMVELVGTMAEEDPTIAQAGLMLPLVLTATSIQIEQVQWVGLEDGFIHRYEIGITFTVDPALVDDSASLVEPLVIALYTDVQLTQINAPVTITPPEVGPQ